MEEIKIWKIDPQNGRPRAVCIETISATSTEQLLEEVLTASPEILMANLRLIGRQNETAGGALDLLGIDEDGRLVVFELKRGSLTRDAVAQAIDYASYLADLEPEALCQHISENSGRSGTERIEDFAHWYQSYFHRSVLDIGRPKIILVGLGVDSRAKRMVRFLSQCELDISLITFHGFKYNGETLLARQVEVQARVGDASVKSTKRDNQTKLDKLVEGLGIRESYEAMTSALKSGLGDPTYQWPNPTGYSFYLPEIAATGGPTNRSYVTLYVYETHKGRVQVYLQPRAVEAAGQETVRRIADSMGSQLVLTQIGSGQMWIDGHQPSSHYIESLRTLGQAVATGWKTKTERQAKEEAEEVRENAV